MEDKLVDVKEEREERKHLPRSTRIFAFVVFWFIMLGNCSDSGIPSASSVHVKKDLNFTDTQFGKFGSLVQIGRITGTFVVRQAPMSFTYSPQTCILSTASELSKDYPMFSHIITIPPGLINSE